MMALAEQAYTCQYCNNKFTKEKTLTALVNGNLEVNVGELQDMKSFYSLKPLFKYKLTFAIF